MINFSMVKLGREPKKSDSRNLRLGKYLALAPLESPASVDWTPKMFGLPWGMMLNDELGDCTCAAAGHMAECWSANSGSSVVLSDADVLAMYEGACGYVPGDTATDGGGIELDVLNYWRQVGVGGHKITSYAEADPKNLDEVKFSVATFGGLYCGLAMPLGVQGATSWDVPQGAPDPTQWGPGTWGGHAVPIVGYDPVGLTCVTWGEAVKMTWAFWSAYAEEAYACMSPDFFGESGLDPLGVNVAQLTADLAEVTK